MSYKSTFAVAATLAAALGASACQTGNVSYQPPGNAVRDAASCVRFGDCFNNRATQYHYANISKINQCTPLAIFVGTRADGETISRELSGNRSMLSQNQGSLEQLVKDGTPFAGTGGRIAIHFRGADYYGVDTALRQIRTTDLPNCAGFANRGSNVELPTQLPTRHYQPAN